MFLLLVGSVWLIIDRSGESRLVTWMFLLLTLTIISVAFFSRSFALRVQDRAIRAEENLRYYILTGKRLDPRVRMGQIIALRFASDEEFVQLVERAIAENLRSNEIKKAIKNWRADYYRA